MNNNQPKVGVGVYILNSQNQLLLGKRKNSHGSGTWCAPGGHLEFMESIEDCARRETEEETGLEILDIGNIMFTNDIFLDENKHYITIHVKGRVSNEATLEIMEPEKCEAWKWFDLDRLPENLFIPTKNFLQSNKKLLLNP